MQNLRTSATQNKAGAAKSQTILVDDKNVTFENLNINSVAEQGFGDMFTPENEIINYETNLNPEFKNEGT